jgi:hypothetical protein
MGLEEAIKVEDTAMDAVLTLLATSFLATASMSLKCQFRVSV